MHHALRICLSSDRNIMVDLGESTIWTSAVLFGSGVRYNMEHKGLMCSLYIDPDCEAATGLVKLYGNFGLISLAGAIERAVRKCAQRVIADGSHAQTAFDEFSMVLGAPTTGRPCDPRVRVSLATLIDCLRDRWPLAGLAEAAGLSPHHFATLFKESTGLPVRTYVRWLRIQSVLRALAIGADQTSAAKAAGYSSALVFTNKFRHMFGVSPSVFAATMRIG